MVEGGGLENRCAARYRGFESPLLRNKKLRVFFIFEFYCVKLHPCKGDSNRSVAVKNPRRMPCINKDAAQGCAGQRAGGGVRSKQDVCDWNPESPLLRKKNTAWFFLFLPRFI